MARSTPTSRDITHVSVIRDGQVVYSAEVIAGQNHDKTWREAWRFALEPADKLGLIC